MHLALSACHTEAGPLSNAAELQSANIKPRAEECNRFVSPASSVRRRDTRLCSPRDATLLRTQVSLSLSHTHTCTVKIDAAVINTHWSIPKCSSFRIVADEKPSITRPGSKRQKLQIARRRLRRCVRLLPIIDGDDDYDDLSVNKHPKCLLQPRFKAVRFHLIAHSESCPHCGSFENHLLLVYLNSICSCPALSLQLIQVGLIRILGSATAVHKIFPSSN